MNNFLKFAPPGHFYSPIPDLDEIKKGRQLLFNRLIPRVPAISLRPAHQLRLIRQFAKWTGDFQRLIRSERTRYRSDNYFFREADAFTLFSMIRRHKPKRIIEVGSGYSSALILDTIDFLKYDACDLTLVEPYTERLDSLLFKSDLKRCRILRTRVQEVDLRLFATLRSGDILFIDSSHIGKVGSDVLHLIFEVIPRLAPGVLVHLHDMFWRFEYPEEWFDEGRCWNEIYFVRAFLAFNSTFRVEFWSSYLRWIHPEMARLITIPEFFQQGGGSLWIRRKRLVGWHR